MNGTANAVKLKFISIGQWTLNIVNNDLSFPNDPGLFILDSKGVYAFVLNEKIVYVGLTKNSFRNRFKQYVYVNPYRTLNMRINALISKHLTGKDKIYILCFTPDKCECEYSGLPVDTIVGLEAALIENLRPEWNIRGYKKFGLSDIG